MPIYTGTNEFDGHETGVNVYINPNNKEEWSNLPYSDEQREIDKDNKLFNEIHSYLSKNQRSFNDEYQLIKLTKSKLSLKLRNYIINYCEN